MVATRLARLRDRRRGRVVAGHRNRRRARQRRHGEQRDAVAASGLGASISTRERSGASDATPRVRSAPARRSAGATTEREARRRADLGPRCRGPGHDPAHHVVNIAAGFDHACARSKETSCAAGSRYERSVPATRGRRSPEPVVVTLAAGERSAGSRRSASYFDTTVTVPAATSAAVPRVASTDASPSRFSRRTPS